jgi:ribosome biogenesis GTPase
VELRELGFDDWFEQRYEKPDDLECRIARVTSVHRDSYTVRNEDREVPAEVTGKLRFSAESAMDLPCVGDWVAAQYLNDDTLAIIHDLLPRRTFLRRKVAGKRIDYQMIAANIDVAFVVQSCDRDFNLRRLERYLVMVNEGGIEPVLLLSKSDVSTPEGVTHRIAAVRQAGIECTVLAFSSKTGSGIAEVQQAFEPGRTYCLLGSSGVGKTTLLNHLMGRDAFETGAVREKDGKGRHVTARRQLVLLESGAMVIDTPGMRELGNIGTDDGIAGSFPEIEELSAQCRFADCTHTKEAGCAVLAAVERGELSEDRHRSYLKLRKEAQYYEMSYLEKRRKDRAFGKFIKTALKQIKQDKGT